MVFVFAPSIDSKYASHAKGGLFMHPFLSAVIGGALIGFSVVLLMFLSGRIAGIQRHRRRAFATETCR